MKHLFLVLLSCVSLTSFSQNLILQEIENKQKQAEGPYNITNGDCIDLGLSVKWASCNLGASSVEEYGGLYSWGEVKTQKKYYNNKYVKKTLGYLQKNGIIDVNQNLTKEYDAASQILGGRWRIPTWSEMEELRTKCKWYKRSYNGVNGYLVQGPNGNTIFLPVTPIGHEDHFVSPTRCVYRTSTLFIRKYKENDTYCLSDREINGWFNMKNGICIRPVQK